MAGTTQPKPDILLIVLDCVRSDLFNAEVARAEAMPFLHSMRSQVLEFPGTVSPASWTIPGHASLFTGLYPWDHGAHFRLGPILTPGPETLGEFLQKEGYATSLYSANAYVQVSTGLTRGFDEALWGSARELFLRFLSIQNPSCPNLGGPALAFLPSSPDKAPPSPLRDFALKALSWTPSVWDGMNRVGGKVLGTYDRDMQSVSPWIEAKLDKWLARQRTDQPVFSFVNLFEAHAPYLAEAGLPVGLARWLSYATFAQDHARWVTEQWKPSPREVEILRTAYIKSLHVLDRRVKQVVERFRAHRDWENTLFVLTSDHGHAFLEQEILYHRFRVDEPISRIPLWVRPPGGKMTGVRSDEWASLIDVPRTIAHMLGRETFGDPSSRDLFAPVPSPDPRTVYCMTDGIPDKEAPGMSPQRREFLNWLGVAAYRGDTKAIAGERAETEVFRVSPADAPHSPALAPKGGPSAEVAELARQAFELAAQRIASKQFHGDVEQRLAGWGY
ncbi:MAG: sulfatase-like hydrolase/transferase [Thermoplasmata archaeon]